MAHLTRYCMYEKKNGYFKEPLKGKILGISEVSNLYSLIDITNAELTEINYPNVDMQNLPYGDNSFDFVISDQVIEHLGDPKKAIKESCRVLDKGGIAIHATCFINYIHRCPKDFWCFSPDGLRFLCMDISEILYCEGWGNRIAILLCFLSDRFRFMRIPENRWSIRCLIASYNEENYPIVTWLVTKK